MPHATALPPFPEGLHETSLVRLSLSSLLSADPATLSSLFETCQSHGFFYMDLTSCPLGQSLLAASDALQELSTAAFALPRETKQLAHQSVTDSLFGWKSAGAVAAYDPYGRSDKGEFWNVSKDDVLGLDGRTDAPYPPMLRARFPLFDAFMRDCQAALAAVLRALCVKLGVDPAEIDRRHRPDRLSGDHVRLTWAPPSAGADGPPQGDEGREEKDVRISTYAHTDFGTITLLFNWLGGLQIENPATKEWEWVRPLPGHAICNLGDAMVVFSGGQLASGRHRVVTAPGRQSLLERYSVVYFMRPEDQVIMEDLTGTDAGSEKARIGGAGENMQGEVFTAKRWIRKRVLEMGNISQKT